LGDNWPNTGWHGGGNPWTLELGGVTWGEFGAPFFMAQNKWISLQGTNIAIVFTRETWWIFMGKLY